MAHFKIKKGMNIRLSGAPSLDVEDISSTDTVCMFPPEFLGTKPRLMVKEGDSVKRGTPLFFDKKNPAFQGCAPATGTVTTIQLGPRRVVEKIEITLDGSSEAESFPSYDVSQIRTRPRDEILQTLQQTGYIAYLRQRPFGKMADAAVQPKAIFVNGMSTAPYRTDIVPAVEGHEAAFQAGLFALQPLTDGTVHLALPGNGRDLPSSITDVEGVDISTFDGPHPAGNTSVHIHHLDPIFPGDVVWAIDAADVVQIGRLLLEGALPTTRVVAVGGPGVKSEACKHYRLHVGGSLGQIVDQHITEGTQRFIQGDLFGGAKFDERQGLPFYVRGLTVLSEDKERLFMGWLAPGIKRFSLSRAYLSKWLRSGSEWSLGTSQNGSHRAMVLTGLYDRYMPMNIMVDYLVRAVIANDTEEAIQLGILETDPEDFGLCSFVCPSKMNLGHIIAQGLAAIEEEGI